MPTHVYIRFKEEKKHERVSAIIQVVKMSITSLQIQVFHVDAILAK